MFYDFCHKRTTICGFKILLSVRIPSITFHDIKSNILNIDEIMLIQT